MLTGDLLEEASRVYVMTGGHRAEIVSWFKSMGAKVQLLREFDDNNDDPYYPDVPDPVGAGLGMYRKCREMMKRAIKGVVKSL